MWGTARWLGSGSRPVGGTSVAGSTALRNQAKARAVLSRTAHQTGLAPTGCSPGQGIDDGQVVDPGAVEVGGELLDHLALVGKLVSHGPPGGQVFGGKGGDVGHRCAPGHGIASSRRARWSTLAYRRSWRRCGGGGPGPPPAATPRPAASPSRRCVAGPWSPAAEQTTRTRRDGSRPGHYRSRHQRLRRQRRPRFCRLKPAEKFKKPVPKKCVGMVELTLRPAALSAKVRRGVTGTLV